MENNDDDMDFNNVECQNIATNAVKLIVPDEKNAQAYQKDKVNYHIDHIMLNVQDFIHILK